MSREFPAYIEVDQENIVDFWIKDPEHLVIAPPKYRHEENPDGAKYWFINYMRDAHPECTHIRLMTEFPPEDFRR